MLYFLILLPNLIPRFVILKKKTKRFYLFLDIGEGREREWERNISVWLSLVHPQLGTWPATQACALTGNRTGDPFALQSGAQSTQPHQPGHNLSFNTP